MNLSPVLYKVAGGLIFNEYNEVVIVNQCGTSWSFPKGHLEVNEKAKDAAIREIYEETGLKNLKYIKNLGGYKRYALNAQGMENVLETKQIYMFLFFTLKSNLTPVDPDNPNAIWVNMDLALSLLTHKKDKAFFSSFLAKNRYKDIFKGV